MRKQHRIILSNGRVLLVEEDKGSIHIATETEGIAGDVDAYICEIADSHVVVWSNSCDAPRYLTEGLEGATV